MVGRPGQLPTRQGWPASGIPCASSAACRQLAPDSETEPSGLHSGCLLVCLPPRLKQQSIAHCSILQVALRSESSAASSSERLCVARHVASVRNSTTKQQQLVLFEQLKMHPWEGNVHCDAQCSLPYLSQTSLRTSPIERQSDTCVHTEAGKASRTGQRQHQLSAEQPVRPSLHGQQTKASLQECSRTQT